MGTKTDPKLVSHPASLVMIGEISHVMRAQGNPTSTSTTISASEDSPVVSGKYVSVPQTQIGIMDLDSYGQLTDRFIDGAGDKIPENIISVTSLDAIFCPYNNLSDDSRTGPYMPNWTSPSSVFGMGKAAHSVNLNPFDPFNQLKDLKSTKNPLASDLWMSGGHNIAYALNYNSKDTGFTGESGDYPNGTGAPIDFNFEKDHFARHTVERVGIRGVGLKSPMVLTGWGYDVNNLPIPGQSENPQSFHPHASWNMKLWKSGPVDLRWDDNRGVWTSFRNRLYLVKMTNLYTPPSFSFEVDRSNTRDQYTRNAPSIDQEYNSSEDIYDPEYVAYQNNSNNQNYYEQLDYNSIEYPYYEAFIIRESDDSSVPDRQYYATWSNDGQDCGHITNPCGGGHGTSSIGKKILVENPLRQSFDVGDLAFTLYTGRQQRVAANQWTGGSGSGASATLKTNAQGSGYLEISNAGNGYTTGGFATIQSSGCGIYTNIILQFSGGALQSGTLLPDVGLAKNKTCNLNIYPNNATQDTELLEIHWIMQAEFKSQQVVTHVESDKGILQSCSMKIQTQGYKTCEWCGEDTAFINN